MKFLVLDLSGRVHIVSLLYKKPGYLLPRFCKCRGILIFLFLVLVIIFFTLKLIKEILEDRETFFTRFVDLVF